MVVCVVWPGFTPNGPNLDGKGHVLVHLGAQIWVGRQPRRADCCELGHGWCVTQHGKVWAKCNRRARLAQVLGWKN